MKKHRALLTWLIICSIAACGDAGSSSGAGQDSALPDSGAQDSEAPDITADTRLANEDSDGAADTAEPEDVVEPDTADVEDEEALASSPSPLFNLAATSEPSGFYDFPFPSDLRLTEQGAPDVSRIFHPQDAPLVDLLVESILRDNRGFSPLAGSYFRFDTPVDTASLPSDPDDSLTEEALTYIVDIEPGSPSFGRRVPVNVHYRAEEGRFWMPDTLALVPLTGWPLRPGALHAAVVRRGLKTVDGEAFEPPEAFTALLADSTPEGREAEWENLRPLVEFMGLARAREELLTASVFTTANPAQEMIALREWIVAEVPVPTVAGWEVRSDLIPDTGGFHVYEGSFPALEFFSGEPPYLEMGEGIIALDDAGAPVSRREVAFRITLTVPEGEMPEGGWPLVLYGHGSGRDSQRFLTTGEAQLSAAVGFAVVSIDHPLHGARAGGLTTSFELHLVSLAQLNPGAGRELYRHAVPDFVQLARMVRGEFAVPGSISHTGEPITFATDLLPFAGHSQGAQAGALLIGVEPLLTSAFLSAAGGGVSNAFLLRKSNDIDIEALVALAMGVDLETEPFGAFHPLVALLVQPVFDGADPVYYAQLAIKEPPEISSPKHIFMTEGLEDPKTVPPSIEALAATFGLPIAEPVAQPSRVHELRGIAPVTLPASGNIQPEMVTGALLQFPGEGHSAFYRVEQAQRWYQEWLLTSLTGTPMISAPEP